MDKLAPEITPDVLIDNPDDDGSFVWVNIENGCLWLVSVAQAKFVVRGAEPDTRTYDEKSEAHAEHVRDLIAGGPPVAEPGQATGRTARSG
jgi:hypothetical protein